MVDTLEVKLEQIKKSRQEESVIYLEKEAAALREVGLKEAELQNLRERLETAHSDLQNKANQIEEMGLEVALHIKEKQELKKKCLFGISRKIVLTKQMILMPKKGLKFCFKIKPSCRSKISN